MKKETKKIDVVRVGVIGLGNMGSGHIANIEKGLISGMKLVAVCDIDPDKLKRFEGKYKTFADSHALITSGEVDAVMIETPHYSHTTIGIDSLANGVHTLVEKPISVHKADALKLIDAHKDKGVVFAAMFNQRSDPSYIKLKDIIDKGMLGEITRVNWIITNWYRPDCYYQSGGWRATWKGEGGGVLMNQCPHQLDLMQWLFGMPKKVRAFCQIGKWHDIEVEDNVTAYLEYENGATGVFITTTGEAPGTNRLEVCGEMGKIVIENGSFIWYRNTVGQREFSHKATGIFSTPENWKVEIPVKGHGGQHVALLQDFIDAIRTGKKLLAPAEEGIGAVELNNAMMLSSFTEKTVEIPLDPKKYAAILKKLAKTSRDKKVVKSTVAQDFANSYGH